MQIISSYGVELRKQNIPIRQTLEIYRSAVSYLTEIYEQVWEELAEIPDAKRRFNAAEHLVHTTKKNPARFGFDLRFPKMPSYLRRAAIQHALGSVSSYETRMELWEKSGEKAGKPRLAYENHAMPVFYRDVMYREEKEGKAEPGANRRPVLASSPKGTALWRGKLFAPLRRCELCKAFLRRAKRIARHLPGDLFQVSPSSRPAGRFVCYAHKNTRFEANTGKYPCLARAQKSEKRNE